MAIKIAGVDVINDDRELVLAKLTDINETISSTAVDVFVYDTSKDTDGGAWRHRTQHTSWYAEASSASRDVNTRSTRAEFPAVAVIVAEEHTITIYDGDDPSLPMWMHFPQNRGALGGVTSADADLTSVAMLNGVLVGGYGNGLSYVNFLSEVLERGASSNTSNVGVLPFNVSERDQQPAGLGGTLNLQIANNTVNDVAMTVLPDAPTDPATGLPVPTIAVATAGGISIITDSEDVYDLTGAGLSNANNASFFGQYLYVTFGSTSTASGNPMYIDVSTISGDITNFQSNNTDYLLGHTFGFNSTTFWPALMDNTSKGSALLGSTYLARGHISGVTQMRFGEMPSISSQNSMVAYTTSSYNTGWMPGDIKLAALADTDTTALSGTALNNTTNYTTEWTAVQSDWTINTTSLVCDGASGAVAFASFNFATAGIDKGVGDQVGIRFTVSSYTSGQLDVSFSNGAVTETAITGAGTYEFTNTISANAVLYLRSASGNSFVGTLDNVEIFDVDPDRSVKGRGLGVHGTITKAAVATGADVVAYSGFTSSNYLEQPYNADLDFGTGDFCVMGWVNFSGSAYAGIAALSSERNSASNPGFSVYYNPTNLYFRVSPTEVLPTSLPPTGQWVHVCAVRTDGDNTGRIYINGQLNASSTSMGTSSSPTNNSATLVVGGYWSGAGLIANSAEKYALLRISGTAPTADQIAKIYEDEKVLFQDSAKATLTGSSDAVTALAHDPDTGLLHVGTSGGRSVFQGLRRVNETATAVTTAISAVDGLVVEQ